MSGGSHNYLCYKDTGELFAAQKDLDDMTTSLITAGAEDAGKETYEILVIIKQATNRVDVLRRRLEGVWHAMEWWDSCDISEESFREELAKYRGR
ncbi:MAG: hypothetical protein FJ006_12735 [Chloroflexi bacterium]|nr:hypothetical protein [Chloroflexota bacterium]